MAARLNPQQDQRSREAIKTTQLVKRLQCFALSEPDDAGNLVDLDGPRLKAIELLLKKTLPDLSSVTVANAEGETFKTEEVGNGAARLAEFLNGIAERSAKAGEFAGE